MAAACGSGVGVEQVGPTDPPRSEPRSTTTSSVPGRQVDPPPMDSVPAVVVRGGDTELTLEPWTACWGNGCFDGAPPQILPEVGSPDEILVEFPVPGWEFLATVQPVGEECGREQTEPLERVSDTVHRLVPIGLADDYEVTLFGRGPGGDVFVSFRWDTRIDGKLPVPAATASILADHDGRVDSYGVSVSIRNLAATPREAVGQVTVTSVDGGSHTFPLVRDDVGCSEGLLHLTAPRKEGLTAAGVGPPPFTYEVTIELDGQPHSGTGVWPADEDPECQPCIPLTFTPPLPRLSPPAVTVIETIQVDPSPRGNDGRWREPAATTYP